MQSKLNVQNLVLWNKNAARHDVTYIMQSAVEFHKKKQSVPQEQWDQYRRYCLIPLRLMEEKYGISLIDNPTEQSVQAIDELIRMALQAQKKAAQRAAASPPASATPAILSMSFPDIDDANQWLQANQNISIVAVSFSKPPARSYTFPVSIKYTINSATKFTYGFAAFEKKTFFVEADHEKLLGKWRKENPDCEIVEHAAFTSVQAWDAASMAFGFGNRIEDTTFVILFRSLKSAASSVGQYKVCPFCAVKLEEDCQFCPQCGKKIK